MKTRCTLFLFAFTLTSVFSQSKSFNELSEQEFNNLINKSFATVVTGQNSSTLGSSASIDPVKTELNFTPMLYSKNGYIFSATFKGGATDGVYSVFNNSKLNSNVSMELQFSFINKRAAQTIIFDVEELNKMRSEKRTTNNKYKIDSLKTLINAEADKAAIVTKIKDAKKLALNIKGEINILEKEILDAKDADVKNSAEKKLAKKNLEKAIAEAEIEESEFDLANFDEINKVNIQDNERIAKIQKAENGLAPVAFGFSWFTIGYKVKNDDFKLIDKSETDFNKQVAKKSFVSHEMKLQYSMLKLMSQRKLMYVTGVIAAKHKSNFDDLKKEEITDVTQINTTTNIVRESSKKYTVYSGNYINGVNQVNLDVDFYYFFKNSTVGLHLFPTGKYVNHLKPIHNLGLGIVLPIKDNKKDKSIINAELYYNVLNVFDTANSELPLIQRNDIGLRFTFPLQLN